MSTIAATNSSDSNALLSRLRTGSTAGTDATSAVIRKGRHFDQKLQQHRRRP
ncbi:hypothetical protein [Bradyrhizobium sp. WD16]|uniref:hypothetical protein n=1 Tax=Bradyrhizobium sp. WD16 TaxID=1521768 RepID=UPI0020A59D32|nr:hypothetical protein [Bradyrhizobium sp. WD16]